MQSTRLRSRSALAIALLVLAFLPAANAETPPKSPAGADAPAAIESLRNAVEANPLAEAQREAVLAQLDAAAGDERAAETARSQLAALRAEATDGNTPEAPSSGMLAENGELALQEWAARLPPDANTEMLESLLERQRGLAAELADQIDEVETEVAQILARPAETAIEIAALRRRADELSNPIQATENESRLALDARQLRQSAELHRVEAELELRRAEQETSLERQRLRELALAEMGFRQRLNLRRIEWLQARIAELGRKELEQRIAELARTEKSVTGGPSVASSVAHDNLLLGDELLLQSDQLAQDREELSKLEPARDRVATSLKDSRTRLELGGASEAVGRWLWSERRSLEPAARLRRRRDDQRSELAELRLRLVTQNDEQRDLADIPAAARTMLEARQAEADDEGTTARAGVALEPLLRERAELLTLLAPVLQRRVKTLERSEAALQEQIETTQTLRQLLDRFLLWTPSHGPIDSTWFERVPEGFSDLVKPSRWKTTAELAHQEILARPFLWIGCLLLLLALVELRRRAPERIREHEAITRQIVSDHIGVTLITFLWTLVAALPGPAALALLGTLLQTAGTPGRYSDSLGRACLALVVPFFAIQTLQWTLLEQGLGHAHFRWMPARRIALRRWLPRAAAIVMPMYFISSLAFIRNLDLPNDVQARTAIVIACGALAWTFWRLFDVGQVWVSRGVESEPSTLRRLLRVSVPIGLLVVAVLALAGYVYSAGLLLEAWLASISTVIAVSLGLGLLGRWFLIGERRLALRRLEEHRASTEQASDEGGGEPRKADITLEQVNAQTGSMLRVLRIILLSVGLVWVWAEVLPAVTRLDEIVLWTFSEAGSDGLPVVQPVSLMAALFGFVALALTVVSSRNLPGLVELGLLSQTSIDAASRYAITSILRYAIVIAGTLFGLDLLGMRWSQLQWMAAALTVGLGFGLQEIFANFVSGLILLFERPFRVGDVITVGDLTGRVTRIRTRATTILDYDNREIFVPNKSFITGQLLNWTLSDTTTRITIKVAVAYGTDPTLVHRLLLEAAHANPLVLSEPEPRSWLLAFGASALEFELRVFVGTLSDRIQAQSDLHREIARLVAENGVEINFPQTIELLSREQPEGPASTPSS